MGRHIGRYVVQARIGAGAMGAVYRVRDPTLERDVAIKVLHSGRVRERDRVRLRREAQAVAAISHPNVVRILDVGEHEGRTYLAMELVEGRNLTEWLAEQPRAMPAKLLVLAQAGRGLAAVHAAGLVHRDFKPDNVLIGNDGRARVVDFGIALHGADDSRPSAAGLRSGSDRMTDPSAGTPAYMAPEQRLGTNVDARADQFAFCVTAFRAIYDKPPYASTAVVPRRSIAPREFPATPALPRSLVAALARGLAVDPDDRHESMEPLLHALSQATSRSRSWVAVALGAAVVGGVALMWPQAHERCDESAAAPPWDDAVRTEVLTAVRESEVSFADQAAPLVGARLDEYVERWQVAVHDACVERPNDPLADERSVCLLAADQAVRRLLEPLRGGDPDAIRGAATEVARLPPIEQCSDAAWLAAEVTRPDPEVAEAVAEIEGELVVARNRTASGRYDDAARLLDELDHRAEATGYEPVRAAVAGARGELLVEAGRDEEAVSAFERAQQLAHRSGPAAIEIDAAVRLVLVHAGRLGQVTEAERWSGFARSALNRHGLADSALGAQVLFAEAHIARKIDDDGGAAWAMLSAARDFMRRHAPHDPSLIRMGLVAGLLLRQMGRGEDAERELRHTLDFAVRTVGRGHVLTSVILLSLGAPPVPPEEALEMQEEAFRIRRQALGLRNSHTILAASNVAGALLQLDRLDDARAVLDEVPPQLLTEVEVPAFIGAQHHRVRGRVFLRLGDYDEALASMTKALSYSEQLERVSTGADLANLAVVHRVRGELDIAEDYARRSLSVMKPSEPAESRAGRHLNLGNVLGDAGRLDEAIAEYRLGLSLLEDGRDNWIRAKLQDRLTATEEARQPR